MTGNNKSYQTVPVTEENVRAATIDGVTEDETLDTPEELAEAAFLAISSTHNRGVIEDRIEYGMKCALPHMDMTAHARDFLEDNDGDDYETLHDLQEAVCTFLEEHVSLPKEAHDELHDYMDEWAGDTVTDLQRQRL